MLISIRKAGIRKQDERGVVFDFSSRATGYFIVIHRKADTTSGDHFHKGKMSSKNPEIVYVVSGELSLRVKHTHTGVEEVHELVAGDIVETPPYIHHSFVAKTDVILLELLNNASELDLYDADTVKDMA